MSVKGRKAKKGLVERLKDGDNILVAEGYMWEFERRGYLACGPNIPEVVIDHPDLVTAMHREFVHAGSDVVVAFTYYGHREKLRSIGREGDLEKLNRDALRMAREVADETGTLMAGDICNSGIYCLDDDEVQTAVRDMFTEQVQWAVEEGADFIIAETFGCLGEAMLALDTIKKHGNGLPVVVTLTPFCPDITVDDVPFPEACKRLEDAGAAVVGLNCSRGPRTLMPLIREIRKVCKGPIAAIPVPYRTREECKTFLSLKDPENGDWLYPANVSCCLCSRADVRRFAQEAREAGVQFVGLCCGNAPKFMREVAETYGRKPPASKYAPDVTFNIVAGDYGKRSQSKTVQKMRCFAIGEPFELP